MHQPWKWHCVWNLVLYGCACLSGWSSVVHAEGRQIHFDRDIRPILSAHCFHCHGPDAKTRKAGLRLDTRDGILGKTEDGQPLVAPQDPAGGELLARVVSTVPEEQMPPPEGGKALSPTQIQKIKQWIKEGAEWQGHWAYERITRPQLPKKTGPQASEHPIDLFLAAKWGAEGISPVGEAEAAVLTRRLSFDLIGLPPQTPAQFPNDAKLSDAEYLQQVDQLLASPHFGERMAVYWLDLVRYADSCGYHSDVDQQVSPYRDYVINAFNSNLHFDQFTREQLAGDLLPGATVAQKIATGFNRLTKATEEGGAQEKEYISKVFSDRVRTVAGTWLAATFSCAECHDHKYDPYTMRDYYSLGAFFADMKEQGVYPGNRPHEPVLLLPSAEEARALEAVRAEEARLKDQEKGLAAADESGLKQLKQELAAVAKRHKELESRIPKTLVTVAVSPREIRILPRGDYLNQTGPVVQPAVPAIFGGPSAAGERLTRRDLADWLTSRDNPLTARVFVNRVWKMYFGQGLSRSLDDFGRQGEFPTHPELLDWLSAEFMESGWDVKHLVRLMVTSRAYRLSSIPSKQQMQLDPSNRLLARQNRRRLDAEFIRDNALSVSGLLCLRIGGPSVKPYQPEGYWEFLNFPKRTWVPSNGEDQYRRGLYTHWQRTFLHPTMLAFDASSREECAADRVPSNTPKSALALLNDPSYIEAARVFAVRVLKEGGSDDSQRLQWAWQTALTRSAEPRELLELQALLTATRERWRQHPESVEQILKVGHAPVPEALATGASSAPITRGEIAVWTSVARAIFNLHEFTTRN